MFDLDWKTRAGAVTIKEHWRLLLCVVFLAAGSTLLWHAFFPHTFWFEKLWLGLVSGGTVGIVVGTVWQVRDASRRPQTSGRFIVTAFLAWSFMSVVGFLLMVPGFVRQEHQRGELRALDGVHIRSVTVAFPDGRLHEVRDPELIARFAGLLRAAELFYPSHERSAEEFEVLIVRDDSSVLEYPARVPERHPQDFSLEFRGGVGESEILIPAAREWLREVERRAAN